MKRYLPIAVAALLLAGCTNYGSDRSAGTEELVTASATVEAVDYDARTVRLRDDASDTTFTVVAGDAVQNLAQVEAGDQVEVDYYESVTLDMADPADSGEEITSIATARAPEGARPAGAAVVTTSLVVQLLDYDAGVATYMTPDGVTHRSTVPPELRSFAEQRRRGDRILVTLTEAAAVRITETG